MTRCPAENRIQALLDGDLSESEIRSVHAHIEDCPACARDLETHMQGLAALQGLRVFDPGPTLTERILDRVLPSRLRRRWVTAIGWTYGTVSAVSTFAFISWMARPGTLGWISARVAEGYGRMVETGLVALRALTFAAARMLEGWGLIGAAAEGAMVLSRALFKPLAIPSIGWSLWAAMAATALVLFWLHGRREPAAQEVRHVDLLGF